MEPMSPDALVTRLAVAIRAMAPGRFLRVAVDGVDGVGKTTFADRLGAATERLGRPVLRASADGFLNPRAIRYRLGRSSPEGFYRDTYDLAALRRHLLEPLAAGGTGLCRRAVHDPATDAPLPEVAVKAAPGTALILDGMFLHRPELLGCRDLSIFLDAPFAVTVPRGAARGPGYGSPDPEALSNRRYVGDSDFISGPARRWAARMWSSITAISLRPGSSPGGPEAARPVAARRGGCDTLQPGEAARSRMPPPLEGGRMGTDTAGPAPPGLFAPVRVERQALPGGGWLLRSREELAPHPPRITDSLWHWAREAPDRPFLRERGPDGAWRGVSYAEAADAVRRIGAALLARGLGPAQPVAVLSGNSVRHALLALAAQAVGVPVPPSPCPTACRARISASCATSSAGCSPG